eukprot:jgi/Ulvmu1/8564/UM045_0006.1
MATNPRRSASVTAALPSSAGAISRGSGGGKFAVIQLSGGARATVHETTFSHNIARAGPVADLYSSRPYVDRTGFALWLADCLFVDNHASLLDGVMVAISDSSCDVYTFPWRLRLWKTDCSSEDGKCGWNAHQLQLKPAGQLRGSGSDAVAEDGFAHVAAAAQPLPRPSDTACRQIMGEAAARRLRAPACRHRCCRLSHPELPLWFRRLEAYAAAASHSWAAVHAWWQAAATWAIGSVQAAIAAWRLRASAEVALQPQRDASSASGTTDAHVPPALLATM